LWLSFPFANHFLHFCINPASREIERIKEYCPGGNLDAGITIGSFWSRADPRTAVNRGLCFFHLVKHLQPDYNPVANVIKRPRSANSITDQNGRPFSTGNWRIAAGLRLDCAVFVKPK
jgi:hypothetical protein